jgi:hypothetical protein
VKAEKTKEGENMIKRIVQFISDILLFTAGGICIIAIGLYMLSFVIALIMFPLAELWYFFGI